LRLEATGRALLLSALALALLYALFRDPVILAVAGTLLALLLYSACATLLTTKRLNKVSVEPDSVEVRLVAGDSRAIEVRLRSNWPAMVSVRHPMAFCKARPQPYKLNEALVLEFSPALAGEYQSDWLELEAEAPFKAFAACARVPLRTVVTVVPRVVAVAVRALELLASMGATGHEVPALAVGRGTEYAETREYMPGDDLRRMDWKATARLQKLMIKEFHQDLGGGVNIVYDIKVAGPVTRDEAAAEFLTLATALTAQAVPYAITIVNEKNEMKTLEFEDARTALLTAIRVALRVAEVDYGVLYELLEPHTTKEALALLKMIEQTVEEKERMGRPKEALDTVVVTCLLGDLAWLMDLHETLKASNRRLVIHVPSRAWLDSKTLEQAYLEYERLGRLLAKFKRLGIEVRTGPSKISMVAL
jgi:uncharacterized protein (DUF58 family)